MVVPIEAAQELPACSIPELHRVAVQPKAGAYRPVRMRPRGQDPIAPRRCAVEQSPRPRAARYCPGCPKANASPPAKTQPTRRNHGALRSCPRAVRSPRPRASSYSRRPRARACRLARTSCRRFPKADASRPARLFTLLERLHKAEFLRRKAPKTRNFMEGA
jgi:hypothetical protein